MTVFLLAYYGCFFPILNYVWRVGNAKTFHLTQKQAEFGCFWNQYDLFLLMNIVENNLLTLTSIYDFIRLTLKKEKPIHRRFDVLAFARHGTIFLSPGEFKRRFKTLIIQKEQGDYSE